MGWWDMEGKPDTAWPVCRRGRMSPDTVAKERPLAKPLAQTFVQTLAQLLAQTLAQLLAQLLAQTLVLLPSLSQPRCIHPHPHIRICAEQSPAWVELHFTATYRALGSRGCCGWSN